MLNLPRWRVILVLIVSVLGIAFSAPNLLPSAVRDNMPTWLPHRTLNLGLDLQGGSHLLLEVDTTALKHQQLDNIADQMATALRDAEPAIRFTGRGVVGDAARIRLINPEDMTRAMAAIRPLGRSTTNGNEITTFTPGADGTIEARMTDASLRELSRQAAQQSKSSVAASTRPARMKSTRCGKAKTASSCRRQASRILKS